MKSAEKKTSLVIFWLIVGAQCLVPLLNIALFQRRFIYPFEVVGYHLLLIGSVYTLLFGGAVLAFLARRPKRAGWVLALSWASFTVILYFGYLMAWGGRIGMGINLTVSMLLPYIKPPFTIVKAMGLAPAACWGILVGGPVAIFLAYVVAVPVFRTVLSEAAGWLHGEARELLAPGHRHRFGAWIAGMCLASAIAVWLSPPRGPITRLFGDPILVTLVHDNDILPLVGSSAPSEMARDTYKRPEQFKKKNVILIIVDDCRADHLGVMGYERDTTPFLDTLKTSGKLRTVHSFYSASCCTFGGVLSLLRSQDWFKMSPRGFALQDVLKKAGFGVHFILSGDFSSFLHLKNFFGNSIDSFTDGMDPAWHFTPSDDRGVFETFDRLPASDGKPNFLYFHFMSVHALGIHATAYQKYLPVANEKTARDRINHYDNGIVQADDGIRELFHRLERKGYLQNSLVVITGDHGESLGERNLWGHMHNLYSEEVKPPLLIYDSDLTVKYGNLEFARQIDVAPTILDRLGLPIPASWDGHSLLRDKPPRFSYLRFADTYAVIDHSPVGTLEYIYDDRTKKEEIYDLESDPAEHLNIFENIVPQEIQELRGAAAVFSVHPEAG